MRRCPADACQVDLFESVDPDSYDLDAPELVRLGALLEPAEVRLVLDACNDGVWIEDDESWPEAVLAVVADGLHHRQPAVK